LIVGSGFQGAELFVLLDWIVRRYGATQHTSIDVCAYAFFPVKMPARLAQRGRFIARLEPWQVYCIILQRTLLEFLAILLVVLSEKL
jgi:hypothetical protein